ncbi:MAG: tail fiber domain-containing protein [Ferruginibacter sp.]
MKNKFLFTLLVSQVLLAGKTFAQNIAINSTGNLPDTSAMLDVSSTVKGFLTPRMTTTERNAIPLPATGLLIYNTTTNQFNVNTGTSGSPSWTAIVAGSTVSSVSNSSNTNSLTTTVNSVTGSAVSIINSNALSLNTSSITSTVNGVASSALDISPAITLRAWNKAGNSGTTAGTNFIGTTDAVDFVIKANNTERLRISSGGNLVLTGTAAGAMTDSVLTINTATGVVRYLNTNRFSGSSSDWSMTGNGSTNASTNFIGTTNSVDFVVRTNNSERLRVLSGGNVGINTTNPGSTLDVKGTLRLSGSSSGYVGFAPASAAGSTTYTLPSADGSNGQMLTTNGSGTLSWSTASGGSGSGWSLTGNSGTSASNYIGTSDGQALTFKVNNTQSGYIGYYSLNTSFGYSSNAAYGSTAIGYNAQATGTNYSVAVGYNSLASTQNAVALGSSSQAKGGNNAISIGYNSVGGYTDVIAIGTGATASSSTNNNETIAIGASANANAYQGIAIGKSASVTTNGQTLAIGVSATANGYQATAIGNGASATASNSTAIGNGASVSTANYISIGNTSVSAIRGQVNFTTYSDGRFKRNIKEDVHGLDFIMKLRPVTYNWDIHKFNAHARGGDYKAINAAYNPDEEAAIRKKESITYTGFIAQEVDQAAQKSGFNFSGVLKPVDEKDAYSLTYAEFVVPLVKAAQELNNKVTEQQKMIETLQQEINILKRKVH